MNNEIFLNQMKNQFESIRYFRIENNKLILEYDGIYKIPFTNVTLSNLNPNLFLQNPKEIFHILYMLELLPKTELTESEIAFITQYVTRYLKLNDLSIENDNMDTSKLWCLSIPIYSSYDPNYINNPCSSVIQNIINSHSEEIENSKGKHPKLVLTNPNFASTYEDDSFANLEKAGFAALAIIGSTVVGTLLYIAYFIMGN